MADNKSILAPKIRFKGYAHAWEQRKFNSIVKKISTQSNADYLPKIEFEDIISGEGRLNKDISNKFDRRKGTSFEANNILYGKLRPYLKNWLFADFKGIALGDFWVFEANNSSSIFDYYLIQNEKYQEAANLSTGTKMPRSDWETVSETIFSIPTNIYEQTAIGTFFRTLDDTITLHQRKLDGLKELKQGYLQQMFPQAGECVPRVRFAGFDAVWKARKIEDFTDVGTGSKDTQDAITNGVYDFYVRSPNIEKINSYSFDGEAVLTVGDGVGVGKVFHYVNGKFDYHQRVYKISNFNGVHGLFFYQYFAMNFIKESQKYNAKTSVDSVRRDMITKMLIPCPTLEEQISIGNFIKNLDEQIATHQLKLEKLKQLKSAYLQKMFV